MAGLTETFSDYAIEVPPNARGNIVYVPLSQGFTAVIDEDEADKVLGRAWAVLKVRRSRTLYAIGSRHDGNEEREWPRKILLHRWIMGEPHGPELDHINGNGLDCRRANLRTANRSQQAHNCPLRVTNLSGHQGVSWDASRNKWRAVIQIEGRYIALGRFMRIEDALLARAEAEERYGVSNDLVWRATA
jgi:hypothetical protein